MENTLLNLAAILYCLLVTSTLAEHQVELYPVYNKSHIHTGYAAKVMIGNPKKEFSLLLDTVTAFLWVVPATELLLQPNIIHPFCKNKQSYSCNESYTCTRRIPRCLMQNYGCKRVAVNEYRDDISFNLLDGTQANFTNSPFGTLCYLKWVEWEDYQQIDGVLGLSALYFDGLPEGVWGSSSMCKFVVDNPLKRAIRNHQMDPIITIALPPLDSEKKAVLILGGRNNELCNLRFETVEPLLISRKCFAQYLFPYLPITHSGNRYEFGYRSIKMGNVTFSSASSEMFAYLHTAKPYIGVPGEFLKAIAQNLNAKMNSTTNKYMVDCQRSFEPFEISTLYNRYLVSPRHFVIKHHPDDTECELAFKGRESYLETLMERDLPVGMRQNINASIVMLGIPFFHQYCVTLNPRDKLINFAPII